MSWRFVTSVLGFIFTLSVSAQTNGIFADFTTSMGSFTCQLSYSNAPITVANFIGLATGERAWLDMISGEVRNAPFYDGTTFHRVVTNFVIQGGSRNGNGTDTPGYAFVDEFSPLLTFGTPWLLAMANSGPDSNGAQFFITLSPFTSGNNTYAIFGRVISGTNVVAAISKVKTDSNEKPVTKVVIQQVTIRRVGAAAEAFDIHPHSLPIVTNPLVKIDKSASGISLTFSNQAYTDNRWYSSTNLTAWNSNGLGIEISAPTSNSVQVIADAPQKFFRFAQVQYPTSTFTPKNVLGRTLTMVFPGIGTNTIIFNMTGGGTYKLPNVASGSVTNYTWSQDPYRGFLWPIIYTGGLDEMTVRLDFTSPTNGTFSGSAYNPFPSPISGTFKLKP